MVRDNIEDGSETKGDLKVSSYRNTTYLVMQAFYHLTDFRVFLRILACCQGSGIGRVSPR